MDVEQRQELARAGISLLETAVLDVLWEAHHRGECIGAAEIGRSADIYGEKGLGIINDAITWGILSKLVQEGRATRCQLTPRTKGFRLSGRELESAGF